MSGIAGTPNDPGRQSVAHVGRLAGACSATVR